MIKNQKVKKNWSAKDRIILDWVTIHFSMLKDYKNVEKQFVKNTNIFRFSKTGSLFPL